jgi:CRISPR-associated protein Csx10
VKHRYLELQAISPLAIRSDYASGGARAAPYITGTTLLGTLAATHRLLRGGKKDEFETLFLSGQIHYPNLYPAFFDYPGMQEAPLPAYPLPKTAQSCKRFPGFRKLPEEKADVEERHGVRDTLLDWAMFKLSSEKDTVRIVKELQVYKSCTFNISYTPGANVLCGATVDHFEGKYYRRKCYRQDELEVTQMMTSRVDTRLQTHTGINRESGTVQENILYNREVFEEDMRFWGMLKLPDDDKVVETFEDFIQEANEEKAVRIGTGRTRGLGQVRLVMGDIDDDKNTTEQALFDSFKNRLSLFNETLHARADSLKIEGLAPFYFVLTLHAPFISCDQLLRYQGTIDGRVLAELPDLSSSTFKMIHQVAGGQRVTGWNELWGTPRINEYAIETGSVFLFESSIILENVQLHALFELEEDGMGRRRAEGFGRVCFSDPFHLEGETH